MAKKTKDQKRKAKLKKRAVAKQVSQANAVYIDESKIIAAFPDKQKRLEYIRALANM